MKSVARARNAISFGGDAGEIGNTFGTEIHGYLAAGEPHYANATEPSIPAAFQDVVLAIQGLHDFHLKPTLQRSLLPRYNFDGEHVLAPDDIATIYDIAPLYKAGIDGTGSQPGGGWGSGRYRYADIAEFRSLMICRRRTRRRCWYRAARTPSATADENDLGGGGSGPGAFRGGGAQRYILFVFVSSFGTNAIDSFQYAIDSNVAPAISISYGDCELQTPASVVAQRSNPGGCRPARRARRYSRPSGDDGAVDCSGLGDRPATITPFGGSAVGPCRRLPAWAARNSTRAAEITGTRRTRLTSLRR